MKTPNNRTFVPGESVASGNSRSDTLQPGAPQTASDGRQLPGSPPAADLGAPAELANHPDYELVKELGRGGMGVVYLARNRMMDRLEVLKVVSKSLLDRPGALERFQQEIRSAARLNHPNIVAAHSVLRPGDLLVFAMEYVDGQDLAEVVARRGALPVANAAFYAHQAALGLQHAHEKSMVHRDIKPNNLMLSQEGRKHVVKILDFGLAKATSEKSVESGLTKTGQMLGTPDYIAPEQTLDAQKADIRADIYSLGCTLYFLLAGRPPFEGSSLYQILQAHHTVEATSLNLLRADVPPELAAIVGRMMAKNPAQRYQAPVEVARALVPFFSGGQSGQPVQAPAGAAPRPIPVGRAGTPARSGTLLESSNLVGPVRSGTLLEPSNLASPARSGTMLEPSALVGPTRNATMLESPGTYSAAPMSAVAPVRSGRRQFGVAIAVGLFAAATITTAAIVLNRDPSPVAARPDAAEKEQPSERDLRPTENESNQAAVQELAEPQAGGNPLQPGASTANSAPMAAVEPAAPAFPAAAPFPAPTAPPPGAQPPSFQPAPQPAPAAPVNQPLPARPQSAAPAGSASALTARPSWQQDIVLPNGKTLAVSHVLLPGDRMQIFKSGMGKSPFEMGYPEDDASSSSGSQKGKLSGPTLVRYANGSPMITAVYKDSRRDGPVRMWDENGAFALYAEYKADYKDARLDGLACVFRDGLPWVLLQYSQGKLGGQYAVDLAASPPKAVPLDPSAEAAPGQASLGEALSRMASLEEQLVKREMTLKRSLADSFNDADQAKRKADAAKRSAKVHREGMARRNAQDRAKAAQTEAAIQAGQRALGGGGGF